MNNFYTSTAYHYNSGTDFQINHFYPGKMFFHNFQIYLSVLFIFPMVFWITYEVNSLAEVKTKGEALNYCIQSYFRQVLFLPLYPRKYFSQS